MDVTAPTKRDSIACPHCRTWTDTVELVHGIAQVDDQGRFAGYTDMDWDSSTTVGFQCPDCSFRTDADDRFVFLTCRHRELLCQLVDDHLTFLAGRREAVGEPDQRPAIAAATTLLERLS